MRFLYRCYFWWERLRRRVRAPVTLGTRALVVRDGGILLVRLTYSKGWYLPGGGVDRGESFRAGMLRELREECAIEAMNPRLFGLYLNRRDGRLDHVAAYVVEEFTGEPRAADAREIAEVKFFTPADLPADLWPGHRRRVEEYFNGAAPGFEW